MSTPTVKKPFVFGVDYVARKGGAGGSEKGRDSRRCPHALKLALYRWAVQCLAGGSEDEFYRRVGPGPGRFSARAMAPVVPLLSEYLDL